GIGIEKSLENAIYYYLQSAVHFCELGLRYFYDIYKNQLVQNKDFEISSDDPHIDILLSSINDAIANPIYQKCKYPDDEFFFRFIQLTANPKHASGLFGLAECYEDGTGVEPSLKWAKFYCTLSANLGCYEAQDKLGHRLLFGEVFDKSPYEGIYYSELAI